MQVSSFLKKTISTVRPYIVILFTISVLKTVLFEFFLVPTGSMIPTIHPGDFILTTKYNYGYSKYSFWPLSLPVIKTKLLERKPNYGDIVIIKRDDKEPKRLVKRVIGLPGDEIKIINDSLMINDYVVEKNSKLFKNYYNAIEAEECLPNKKKHLILLVDKESNKVMFTSVFNVPQDHYFLMGDNRNNSDDSRFNLGYVHSNHLIARAQYVLIPSNNSINPFNWNKKRFFSKLI
ncbi:signal peptidase I [Candidatus Sneabacter namystus]|uniref:Signal peptidase I n=1 Tax=Candidatus Sneabacter namystus TaxID=2601646 RepID=A0A5C0UH74_9RICK|nr:signal peptidase I [Candidatus Sneabacter namystus]QEK39416.1 signal peptidase I [Candidatus Sneabacter namystus]